MPEFAARDADWETRVRDSFGRQGLMGHLQARITRAKPGLVEIEIPFRAEFTQQNGYFHAGASSAIADTAGGYAAYSLFLPDTAVLTVEFKINLVAPAKGDRLRAIGAVIKTGRTLTICDLKVFAISGEREILCATGLQTLICLNEKAESAAT
jgi:uncharacterized protein (TIGR00369 family)